MNATLYKMMEGYTLSLTNDIDDLYAISDEELANHHDLKLLSVESCESLFTEDANEVKVYIEMDIIGKTKVLKISLQPDGTISIMNDGVGILIEENENINGVV